MEVEGEGGSRYKVEAGVKGEIDVRYTTSRDPNEGELSKETLL